MKSGRTRDLGSVLILALLVSAAGSIAGMYMVLRWDLISRANRYLGRAADASRLGLAGLQAARERLDSDPGWTGGALSDPTLNGQTINVSMTSLGIYRARASSTGAVGDATQTIVGDLRAVSHRSVAYSVYSATTVEFDNATVGGYVRANGDVTAIGELDFSGNLQTLDGSAVPGDIDSSQVVFVQDPLGSPSIAFTQYISGATPLLGLPIEMGTGAILLENTSLRPDNNPFGGTNAFGAYLIDAGGQPVVIRDVYVLGCLLIRGASSTLIEQGYHHNRAELGLASIITDGPLEVRLENALNESDLWIDYNGDGDLLDSFAPSIEGVVCTMSTFVGPFGGTVSGTILGYQVTITGMPTLEKTSAIPSNPVVGFIEPGPWDLVAGSIGKAP